MTGEVKLKMKEGEARLLLDVLLDAMDRAGGSNLGRRMADEIRPLYFAVNRGLGEAEEASR